MEVLEWYPVFVFGPAGELPFCDDFTVVLREWPLVTWLFEVHEYFNKEPRWDEGTVSDTGGVRPVARFYFKDYHLGRTIEDDPEETRPTPSLWRLPLMKSEGRLTMAIQLGRGLFVDCLLDNRISC